MEGNKSKLKKDRNSDVRRKSLQASGKEEGEARYYTKDWDSECHGTS